MEVRRAALHAPRRNAVAASCKRSLRCLCMCRTPAAALYRACASRPRLMRVSVACINAGTHAHALQRVCSAGAAAARCCAPALAAARRAAGRTRRRFRALRRAAAAGARGAGERRRRGGCSCPRRMAITIVVVIVAAAAPAAPQRRRRGRGAHGGDGRAAQRDVVPEARRAADGEHVWQHPGLLGRGPPAPAVGAFPALFSMTMPRYYGYYGTPSSALTPCVRYRRSGWGFGRASRATSSRAGATPWSRRAWRRTSTSPAAAWTSRTLGCAPRSRTIPIILALSVISFPFSFPVFLAGAAA